MSIGDLSEGRIGNPSVNAGVVGVVERVEELANVLGDDVVLLADHQHDATINVGLAFADGLPPRRSWKEDVLLVVLDKSLACGNSLHGRRGGAPERIRSGVAVRHGPGEAHGVDDWAPVPSSQVSL